MFTKTLLLQYRWYPLSGPPPPLHPHTIRSDIKFPLKTWRLEESGWVMWKPLILFSQCDPCVDCATARSCLLPDKMQLVTISAVTMISRHSCLVVAIPCRLRSLSVTSKSVSTLVGTVIQPLEFQRSPANFPPCQSTMHVDLCFLSRHQFSALPNSETDGI